MPFTIYHRCGGTCVLQHSDLTCFHATPRQIAFPSTHQRSCIQITQFPRVSQTARVDPISAQLLIGQFRTLLAQVIVYFSFVVLTQ